MPTERFYRLTEEKKSKIREAALNEFIKNSVDKASINQIVKEAGISRGSFYTYFDGKWDAVRYLFEEYIQDFYQSGVRCLEEAGGNIWKMLESFLEQCMELSKREKQAAFVRNMLHCSGQEGLVKELWSPDGDSVCANRNRSLAKKVYKECVGVTLSRMSWDEFNAFFQLAMAAAGLEVQEFFNGEPAELVRERFRMKESILRRAVSPRIETESCDEQSDILQEARVH